MTLVGRLSSATLGNIVLLTGLLLSQSVVAREDLSSLTFHPMRLQDAGLSLQAALHREPAQQRAQQSPGQSVEAEQDQRTRGGIAQFDTAIDALQGSSGPYALELAELMQGKGMLLQNLGEHSEALDAFESSMHVLRVNHGLYNAEQIPVFRAMIHSKKELGDLPGAHNLQEALFHLQLQHHGADSLAATDAYIEWADWNVKLFLDGNDNHGGSPDAQFEKFENPVLTEAYNNYANALQLLQEQKPLPNESMITTERKLAAVSYIVRERLQASPVRNSTDFMQYDTFATPKDHRDDMANMALFNQGSSALRRAISYSINAPEPSYADVAQRIMELADWHLLFDRRAAAIEMYEDALALLANSDIPQGDAARLLAAGLPVQTPDAAYRATPESLEDFDGYIDVEISVNKFGMASDPEILSSKAGDERIERELLRTIRSCKFRPSFEEGAVLSEDRVQLRYYYTLR